MRYPITIEVSPTGSVFIETPERQVGMNRWSEGGQQIAASLGGGEHLIHDSRELHDTGCEDFIRSALS